MKTTLNIDAELLRKAMQSAATRTKTETVELGLKELIARKERKKLAKLFGAQKNITKVRRR